MRPDRLHIAVRPRGILECLDLAVLFCSRRPLGVALAAAAGAVPCMLLNRLLLTAPGEDSELLTCLFLAIEAPWAAVPLTLFLGQAVFTERFSWTLAMRSFLGGLPALVLFQGVLRGICLVTIVLAPIAFVSMYHLDSIILLERPGLSRVWSRRTALNMRGTGHVLGLVIVQAIVLFVGVVLLAGLFDAVASAWRGFAPRLQVTESEFTVLESAGLPLSAAAAFWIVSSFLTVFQFFTYLDTRIRREGWDVELKLRSPATYSGLTSRRTGNRPRAAVRAIASAGILLATAGSAWADAPVAATAGRDAGSAFERQQFPWYDSPNGEFRPLIRPRRAAVGPRRHPSSGASGGEAETGHDDASSSVSDDRSAARGRSRRAGGAESDGVAGGRTGGRVTRRGRVPADDLGWIPDAWGDQESGGADWTMPAFGIPTQLMIGVATAVIGVALWLIVRDRLARPPALDESAGQEPASILGEEHLAALPAAARGLPGDLLVRAEQFAVQGDYNAAIVCFHGWQLVALHGLGVVELARGKTNGRYAAEVAGARPALAPLFRRSNRLFEDAFFGRLTVSGDDFASVWERRREFVSAVSGGA